MVIDIKKNISDDQLLMTQIKEHFEDISAFLGRVGNNSWHQAEHKKRIKLCVTMRDVLLTLDNFLYILDHIFLPRARSNDEYKIGQMLHQQIFFIRAVIEQYCDAVLNDRNFAKVKKIGSLLTYLRLVVDITACIPNIEYYDPLEHRTQSMALILKSYLMYNVLNGTWFQ